MLRQFCGFRGEPNVDHSFGIGLAGDARPLAANGNGGVISREEISSRVAVLPITTKVAALANQFSTDYSSDPCDRLIGATALAQGMILVSKDAKIRDCKQLQTLW